MGRKVSFISGAGNWDVVGAKGENMSKGQLPSTTGNKWGKSFHRQKWWWGVGGEKAPFSGPGYLPGLELGELASDYWAKVYYYKRDSRRSQTPKAMTLNELLDSPVPHTTCMTL